MRARNGSGWKTYQLLKTHLPEDADVEIAWGRHLVLAFDGRFTLASLNRDTNQYEIDWDMIKNKWGDELCARLRHAKTQEA